MIQNVKFWNDKDYENSAMIKKKLFLTGPKFKTFRRINDVKFFEWSKM